MLRVLLALLMTANLAALDSVAAAARDYPFCLKGCDFGSGDCSFDSYPQCQASASGRDASCAANPFFQQSRDPQPARYNLSRRRL